MRPESQLKRGREIRLLLPGAEQREIPPLILEKTAERDARIEVPLRFEECVTQIAALQKLIVGNLLPVTKLQRPLRREPIGALRPIGNSLPSDSCIANDVALVGVAIQIAYVPVEETALRRLDQAGQIGIGSLNAEIKMANARHLGEIKPGIVRSAARIADRRNLVFNKRVFIQRQPVSEAGNAIAEIKGRTSITRIMAAANGIRG